MPNLNISDCFQIEAYKTLLHGPLGIEQWTKNILYPLHDDKQNYP